MGPQKTTCDSLELNPNVPLEVVKLQIDNTIFRFTQEFKLKRLNGLQYGKFYSCDGISGYLLVMFSSKQAIHRSVPITMWKELIISTDPDRYYLESIKEIYPPFIEDIE